MGSVALFYHLIEQPFDAFLFELIILNKWSWVAQLFSRILRERLKELQIDFPESTNCLEQSRSKWHILLVVFVLHIQLEHNCIQRYPLPLFYFEQCKTPECLVWDHLTVHFHVEDSYLSWLVVAVYQDIKERQRNVLFWVYIVLRQVFAYLFFEFINSSAYTWFIALLEFRSTYALSVSFATW